jgi:DNA repair exonuclease SbcCD ATPase subunit
MGSGKTTILSQLHPWSNIGVLDERNSDQMIRTGKDGSKHIVFKDGNDEFDILHKYTWTKDHHSTKSFFKFNGEELNPNGNVSTFKELVTKMMGVDQSYLRITRLGPNVSNLIDMPWNQRKSYVASIIEGADIYATILTEIRNMIKTCDAELSTLTKMAMDYSDQDLIDMKNQEILLNDTVDDESKKILNMYADIQQLSAIIKNTKSKYDDDIQALQSKLSNRIDTNSKKLTDISVKITELDKGIDIGQLMMDIGKYSANVDTIKRNRVLLENQASELTTQIQQMESKKLSVADSQYMNSLVTNYEDLVAKLNYYHEQLSDYKQTMTPTEIKGIVDDIHTLDEAIFNVKSFSHELLLNILNSKGDPVSFAKNQITKIQDRILILKRQITNMRFVDGYDASYELPEIKNSACLECPYYKTHPNVMKKTDTGKLEKKIKEKQIEIEECQSKINALEDYSVIYSKITQCEKIFADIKGKVQKLGAMKISDMKSILLSANPVWYDYDIIIKELEKSVNYNEMNILQSKVIELKTEIDKYSSINMDDLVRQIQDKNNMLLDTKLAIKECDEDIDKLNEKISTTNELMNDYHSMDELKRDKEIYTKMISDDTDALNELIKDNDSIQSGMIELNQLQGRFNELQSQYTTDQESLKKLSQLIENVESSKNRISALQEKKYVYELIKDASSPQTGIPLLYVQMFLNDCISITNQLISMVLDESVEIMGLDLSKPDMKIPYRKNGEVMEDVKSASQGERAAISLALSFAFMHKCLSMNKGDFSYNILLLDEIDAPFDASARDKCIQILAQQIKVNNVEQVFFITHNDRYDGYPVNVIATTDSSNIRKDVPMIGLY